MSELDVEGATRNSSVVVGRSRARKYQRALGAKCCLTCGIALAGPGDRELRRHLRENRRHIVSLLTIKEGFAEAKGALGGSVTAASLTEKLRSHSSGVAVVYLYALWCVSQLVRLQG